VINYSLYPVLKGALQQQHIQEIDDQAIIYAKNNIEKYTPTKILKLDLQVFLSSIIILRNLNNNYLTRKFVSNYGKSFEGSVLKDIDDLETRREILEYFGVFKDLGKIFVREKESLLKIHMLDYLELMESFEAPPNQLKLPNQILEKGNVIIEKPRFVYLLRLALESKLFNKIKNQMKEYKENKLINEFVQELDQKYIKFDGLKAPSPTNTPDSIKLLIDKAYREHYLDHRERIKIGIYLQKYGYDMDYILDIFRQLTDWNEKITRYQLNSLKRYIKP